MLVFEERRKLEYLKKNLSGQGTRSNWLTLGHVPLTKYKMYPDWDTIPQLLPSELFVWSAVIVEGKVYTTKHLMYGPLGNIRTRGKTKQIVSRGTIHQVCIENRKENWG